jgi:hypothetical protein
VVVHIQDEILAHDGQTDQCDVSGLFHLVGSWCSDSAIRPRGAIAETDAAGRDADRSVSMIADVNLPYSTLFRRAPKRARVRGMEAGEL